MQENRVDIFPSLKNEAGRSVMSFLNKAAEKVDPCSTHCDIRNTDVFLLKKKKVVLF